MPGRLLSFGKPRLSFSSSPEDLSSQGVLAASKLQLISKEVRADPAPKAPMDHLKRPSLAGLTGKHGHNDKKHDKKHDKKAEKKAAASPRIGPVTPKNNLQVTIESPPLMFQLGPAASSGALLSGRLKVQVVDPEIKLVGLDMQLVASVTTRKPITRDCPECQMKTTELKKWTFLKDSHLLEHGNHEFPFSHLLAGHLPTTTSGRLATLEYSLVAEGKTATGETLSLRKALNVSRALKPGNDKSFLRIFPPTNLTSHVTLNPVIYPTGEFDVQMLISGISSPNKDGSINRWRLRKMNWRIQEEEKIVSPACSKHAHKVVPGLSVKLGDARLTSVTGGVNKGVLHEEIRSVGAKELQEGWKNDWSEGNIHMEFSARPQTSPSLLCDVESPTGLSVKHHLVIELVVAEEYTMPKKLNSGTPTGAARVLRMQFPLHVTERAGLGISWDEEQPPMYEDVPASPPSYPVRSDIANYTGPPLDDPPPFSIDSVADQHPEAESSLAASRRGITAEDLNLLADDERPPTPEEDDDDDEGEQVVRV